MSLGFLAEIPPFQTLSELRIAEARAGGADPLQDQQEILEGPRQTVEFPDDEHIARREPVEQAGQFRTVPAAAGCAFLMDAPGQPAA